MTEELAAQSIGETVTVPDLQPGDEILFTTARGRVHAARVRPGKILTTTSSQGNVYITFPGYRIHQDADRSSFGNLRYFTVRVAYLRKF